MHENIIIRRSELKDAKDIYNIYSYWAGSCIDGDPDKKFYALINAFTFEQIEKISQDGYAAVAVQGDKVLSFYLINPYFDTGTKAIRKDLIAKMIAAGILPQGFYALSLLSSTEKEHLGKGLNSKTLHHLRDLFQGEYDYFIGIMSYDNIATHKSSLKMGWKHFGDVGIGLLAVIGTSDKKSLLLERQCDAII